MALFEYHLVDGSKGAMDVSKVENLAESASGHGCVLYAFGVSFPVKETYQVMLDRYHNAQPSLEWNLDDTTTDLNAAITKLGYIRSFTPESLARAYHEEYFERAPQRGYHPAQWWELSENARQLLTEISRGILERLIPK